MASLTIRKLDETVKAYLRLRSAGNGRSVEEEVRVILGELIQGRPELPGGTSLPASTAGPATRRRRRGERSVTLIIGGGIAAFKSLELIRRLKERHDRRPLRADQGRAAIRHAAFRQRACRMSASIRICSTPRASSTPAISGLPANAI